MKPSQHKTPRPKRGPLGWTFTPEEEARARRAIRAANKFMQSYGKGREPIMINRENYL